MALQDGVIPVDFGGGVDTKTDPKKVIQGQYLSIQNGVFTNLSRVAKRNGYEAVSLSILGGGSLVAPKMVKSFNDELVCQDNGTFYGFSPTLNVWVPKGSYQSVDFSKNSIYSEISCTGYVDVAVLNNIAVYAWDVVYSDQLSNTFATIIDIASGDVLVPPVLLSNFGNSTVPTNMVSTAPRCVVLGGTTLAVTYLKNSTGDIAIRPITVSAGGITFNPEIIVGNNTMGAGLFPIPFYDIRPTTTGAVISFRTDAVADQIITHTLSAAGAITGTANTNLIGNNAPGLVCVKVDPTNGNIWVYFGDYGNAVNTNALKYRVYTSALATVLTPTIIDAGQPAPAGNIAVLSTSTTQQTIYYSLMPIAAVSQTLDQTYTATVTSGGVVSAPTSYLQGVLPQSRVFTVNSRNYMMVLYRGPTKGGVQHAFQPTYFVVDLATASVVARFAAAVAYSTQTLKGIGYTCGAPMASSSSVLLPYGVLLPDAGSTTPFTGIASATLTFNTGRCYKSKVAGQNLILNGALLSAYDGRTCAEWGFHMAPEIFTATVTGSGGNIGTGNYLYTAVFQWTDAQGNLHQSAPSLPVAVTVGVDNSTVTLSVSAAFLSGKTSVHVYVFRTLNAQTIYHEVVNNAHDSICNLVAGFNTIVDTTADTVLQGNLELYTTGGVVPNTPSPPAMILEPRLLRLWLASQEDSSLWYTKSYSPGTGLSPSAFLTYQVDPSLGNAAALAAMDDKMVLLKDRGILWFSGEGATDVGSGSSLTQAQTLPSDVGCKSLGSVLVIPKGIMFQSANGWYLLDRSLGLHYADEYFNGASVEAFNSQTFVDTRLIPGVSQVRILSASGSTLVYDYIFNKWGVFTNHLGTCSDINQGTYYYLRTDGAIYKENTSSYLDVATAYTLRAQTSWLALGSIQGFERVRIAQLLGDYASGTDASHGVQMSFAYDFVDSYSTPIPFSFSPSASGVFQYRTFPTQQKCDSISLILEEIATGASGEYIDFTNLSFNAGLKKGLNKLTAGNSVG